MSRKHNRSKDMLNSKNTSRRHNKKHDKAIEGAENIINEMPQFFQNCGCLLAMVGGIGAILYLIYKQL